MRCNPVASRARLHNLRSTVLSSPSSVAVSPFLLRTAAPSPPALLFSSPTFSHTPTRSMNFIRSFFSKPPTSENVAMASQKVQKLIDDNAVVVFSKSYCPYCTATKNTLKEFGAKFLALELDNESDGAEIQAALAELNGQRTVPNIYIAQKHIGGNSDLQSLKSQDKLEGLLKASGALKA